MLDQPGRRLRAALGFAGLPRPSYDRALHALRTWLDSWSGIGHVAVGVHRQGFDLSGASRLIRKCSEPKSALRQICCKRPTAHPLDQRPSEVLSSPPHPLGNVVHVRCRACGLTGMSYVLAEEVL